MLNILLNHATLCIVDMPVMAKPSAENVGREFVRQYYTMLNRDPRQVHRLVYGGLNYVNTSNLVGHTV